MISVVVSVYSKDRPRHLLDFLKRLHNGSNIFKTRWFQIIKKRVERIFRNIR